VRAAPRRGPHIHIGGFVNTALSVRGLSMSGRSGRTVLPVVAVPQRRSSARRSAEGSENHSESV
jgi:hypothetical protein